MIGDTVTRMHARMYIVQCTHMLTALKFKIDFQVDRSAYYYCYYYYHSIGSAVIIIKAISNTYYLNENDLFSFLLDYEINTLPRVICACVRLRSLCKCERKEGRKQMDKESE